VNDWEEDEHWSVDQLTSLEQENLEKGDTPSIGEAILALCWLAAILCLVCYIVINTWVS
jgi:hypothetical protein